MKTLLLAATLAAASLLSSCSQDPQSANGPAIALHTTSAGGSTSAHPAVTYNSSTGNGGNLRKTIAVMDSDGTHQTNIYTAGSGSESEKFPTWSADGGSISWLKNNSVAAIDLSVNSSGVPVGSNQRTIATGTSSISIVSQAWSTVSTTGKVIFIGWFGGTGSTLYAVSTSGGTWTTLAGTPDLGNGDGMWFESATWSPDDSKIAISQHVSTSIGDRIMIFDLSTGTFTDSISLVSGYTVMPSNEPLTWSHSGMNEIAFHAFNPNSNSSTAQLFYVTPSNGSTPSTNSIVAGTSAWSSNNSSILFTVSGALKKVVPYSTSITTVLSSFAGATYGMDWKH